MKKTIIYFPGWLFCTFLLLVPLQAQIINAPQAVMDNVFVNPGQIATWNVLLNDNPGVCSTDELTLTIVTPPQHAMIYQVETGNRIRYRAQNTTGAMKDSLQYEISCNGQTSRAWVYIYIRNQPDNMYTDVCHITPPAISFGMTELSRTDNLVNPSSCIVCGDIDNDGEIEILVLNSTSQYTTTPTAILIFGVKKETNALYLKYQIDIDPALRTNGTDPYGQIAIGNVDGDGYAAIFFTTITATTGGRMLLKYRFNSSTYEEHWRVNYSTEASYTSGIPLLADFGADGNVQVQVYDKIFNAKDGVLLADGKLIDANINNGTKYNFGWHGHAVGGGMSTCFVAGDIDGDGIPELVAGDCVYKVNITNHSGEIGNSFELLRRANNTPITQDPARADIISLYGSTALVDMDGDGQLDVVVAAKRTNIPDGSLYIYNPQTGEVMNTNQITGLPIASGNGPSMAFIGDFNGDGQPDIAVNGCYLLTTFSYDPQTKLLEETGKLVTTDGSASTTLTLFDFTQNKEAQFVYRDEDNLRILDGKDLSMLGYAENVYSPTVNEYAIVADVNGDGHAEIITIGADVKRNSDGTWNRLGNLRIYGAAGTEKWAPARSVWHQYTYNPLYVNDDLTIPANPMSPATSFTGSDGKVNRPFNNFLQQGTLLNSEGEMLWRGPDLAFSNTKRASIIFEPELDRLKFTIYVSNDGSQVFPLPLRVSTYVYDSQSEQYYHLDDKEILQDLPIGETKEIIFYLENYSSLPFPASYDHWIVFLNAEDNVGNGMPTFAYGNDECNYWNNYTDKISFSYGERVMCEGETEWMSIIPVNTYKFYWYENPNDPDGSYIDIADARYITKDSSPIQRYYIDVYSEDGTTKLTSIRDTVFVFLAPDSLVWTGSGGNGDWHNPENWFNPNAPVPNPYPTSNIPRACTNVLIPGAVDVYPDLSPSVTVYSEEAYTRSECNNIHFEHGGVIAAPDSLHYNKAYVQLELDSHRWYMLSAPLQHLYTGDYYVNDPNPHNDEVFVYTRLYAQPNPKTGETNEDQWGWTGLFHNPDVNLSLGQGLSLWVDNKDSINVITPHLFDFPKHNTIYGIYNKEGEAHKHAPVARANQHRFIFEEGYDPATGEVTLPISASAAGEQLLVGNPFMSHLSFEEFYNANSSKIKNYYKILDATDGSFITYEYGGATTGTPPLNGWIAPMQAFIVEAADNLSFLTANPATMTSARKEETLRTVERGEQAQVLTIEVYRGKEVNKTLLIYSPDAIATGRESIPKTFLKYKNQAVNIYTLSEEGIPLDLNHLTELDGISIPVGIRTSVNGEFRINVAGLTNFAPEYDIYLCDRENPAFCQNLRTEGSMSTFEKTSEEVFDNRFELRFLKQGTSLPQILSSDMPLHIYATEGNIHISTTDGSSLEKVTIYDLSGRKISGLKDGVSATQTIPVFHAGIYLVNVMTEKGVFTAKIIVR
ncbi:MAG: T9SS type A sorting domain-containing protein [Candidatus Azobacteroides sp.]|nr:T9SS type A sorting domain-containing protein [Candidatus Azobacteroides sp.]